MPRTSVVRARLRAAVLTVGLSTAALTATSVATVAPAAHASSPSAAQVRQAKVQRALAWVAHEKGKPYHYGSAGPSRFDCSGLVLYVFKHAINKSLSHNAEAQYRATQHISRSYLRPGDLVFEVDSRGYAFHVGIYAGSGYIWHAPHSGTTVKKQKMWSSRWRCAPSHSTVQNVTLDGLGQPPATAGMMLTVTPSGVGVSRPPAKRTSSSPT
jgi:cell wall-associated NlpC family hydrolase